MKNTLRIALFLAGLVPWSTGPVLAQQTIVVDQAGGAGSQYTQIQPAIDAANPGDIILVRPSGLQAYWGFTVDKPLRLVGQPGAEVTAGNEAAMRVEGLLPGEVVVLDGFKERYSSPFFVGLVLKGNAGTVHCENLEILFYTIVDRTSQASFQDCTLADVHVTDGDVLFSNTTAVGYFDTNCFCRIPALDIGGRSRVTVAGGSYIGPDSVSQFNSYPDAAIVLEAGARLVVTGDSDTRIQAGAEAVVLGGPVGAPAIRTLGGEVVIDPDPTLIPSGNSPEIGGPAEITEVQIPYLHTSLQGNDFTMTVETWANATVRLFVSPFVLPFPYRATTPDIWVGQPRLLASGTAPSTGIFTRTFTMPNLKLGLSFPMQAVVVRNGDIYLSNPVVAIVAPR